MVSHSWSFVFFWPTCGMLVPLEGWNPCAPCIGSRVLMAGRAGKSQLCLFLLSVCLPQFLGFIMLQAPLSTKSISVKGLLWKWKRLEGVDTSISFLDRKDLFCFAQETFTHLCLSPVPPFRPTPGDLQSLPLTYSWILKLSALIPQWFSSNKPT